VRNPEGIAGAHVLRLAWPVRWRRSSLAPSEAMSVGLLRSETASDLRMLTATGAGRTARRAISATTAGALALIGAIVGIAAGYIPAIGFFRTSQLDTLASLASIPVANLLLILAGREPSAIGRRPLE
jgi:putative ABC transport system permease protein